jgi:deoxyhypusine synthase
VSRGHSKNKLFNVWLSEEEYHKFEEFLDKFSVEDTLSDRTRSFIHWLGEQTEGIDRALFLRCKSLLGVSISPDCQKLI